MALSTINGTKTRKKYLACFRIGVLLFVTFLYLSIDTIRKNSDEVIKQQRQHSSGVGRHLLEFSTQNSMALDDKATFASNEQENCTPAAINEFPADGLSRQQRKGGYVLLHAALACYLFVLLACVCDEYFVPAIKMLCDGLQMKEDIAGATFMATASSSPELFINCVGTFITEGDIGVGTIVGSAVFNVLAVPACCGLVARMVMQLEWWPITRDSIMYGVSVMMLIFVLRDSRIDFWEAAMLVSTYVLYILMMCFNSKMISTINRVVRCCKRSRKNLYKEVAVVSEKSPLLQRQDEKCADRLSSGFCDHMLHDTELTLADVEELEESINLWEWPSKFTAWKQAYWVLTWPISFLLKMTIPDCKKYRRLYVITFIMCIFWIGTASYVVAWMITVVGDTLEIPDSVMGLTFLAAGTSVPEAVSSIIVTNQGHGSMGLSSSIGSNTFDIMLCLGLPWLIKSWFYPKIPGNHFIDINSEGLSYSAISLFSTLVLFYFSLLINKFKLDWKVGLTCLLMYIAFLTVASLIELNVFFPVNFPTCDR